MSGPTSDPPRVAVIIPAYNRADLLPQAVESILAQTYGDWEALIVDDGSSDATFEVAEGFSRRDPERITALRLERNQGIAAARNAAIRASRDGELLCLLDSDDYWAERYLERSVEVYDSASAEGRKVGIVSSNAFLLTPDGLTDETWFDRNGMIDPIDLDSMIRHNYLFARAIFSRAAWEDSGGALAPQCRGSDDYDLWLRIMEQGYEALAIREPLVVYRDHPGSDSRDVLARTDGVMACYQRALERGLLTPSQVRRVRRAMRYWLAMRDRELLYQAVAERRPLRATRLAFQAVPRGVMAVAQEPSRWGEWMGDLLRPARRALLARRERKGANGRPA